MAYHTMEEATEGLTPDDVKAMRSIHTFIRRMMCSDSFQADTDGEFTIKLMSVKIAGIHYLYDASQPDDDKMGGILGNLYLAATEVLWRDPDFAGWFAENKQFTKSSKPQV